MKQLQDRKTEKTHFCNNQVPMSCIGFFYDQVYLWHTSQCLLQSCADRGLAITGRVVAVCLQRSSSRGIFLDLQIVVEFCCISNSPSWLGSYLEELLVNITCRSSFRVHNKSGKILWPMSTKHIEIFHL